MSLAMGKSDGGWMSKNTAFGLEEPREALTLGQSSRAGDGRS